nr:rust resistance kinase Lr10-like [Ziziphus jujuba var. spinosa]
MADIGLGAARKECSESRYCRENGPPIRFPFRLKHRHPDSCGYPGFSVSCTSTNHTALELSIDSIPTNFLLCDLRANIDVLFREVNEIRLEWSKPKCGACEAKGQTCNFKNNNTQHETACFGKGVSIKAVVAGGTVGSSVLVLAIIALIYHVYKKYKNDTESRLKIEKFLEDYRAFKPFRYSYADIKKITNQFEDKLGEGAHGSVFKGKLSNDILVAVKMLNNSTGNGEDFVNEVSTIGRIHHVNVVRLVGFCADGFRRALVYEFLPNGSLQKHIASIDQGKKCSLNWETMQDITLGIANGVEYLHQGCDQRILHFDIKPNNVLLDNDFTPKISDFGLAKLCSKDQSLVSMTTARGTLGYIAPEVFSRNFGNVSYKSDVYSFGMLLLEMVGGRKNVEETAENADQVYYPEWIYNLLEDGEDLRIHIDDEGDAKIAKKLAIVGLWCIQWHPGDRPSMKTVVQMLEGGDKLTMPPNPFASTGTKRMNTHAPKATTNMKQGLEMIPE